MTREWERLLPSPFLKGSAVFHAVGAVGASVVPDTWPLWFAGLVANHLILSTVGLVPRGTLLGPNLTRLPPDAAARGEVAITIDDGPDPQVTPAVLDILARFNARATFFCIGRKVRENAVLARQVVGAGHSIENHTARHPHDFSLYGPRRLEREVALCQSEIESVTGERPVFFRAPAGLRNPLLQPILSRHGVQLASWTRRAFDTVEADPGIVSRRLLRGLAAGDILLLHDGAAARSRADRPVVLDALPVVLAACRDAGLMPVTLRQGFGAAAAGG